MSLYDELDAFQTRDLFHYESDHRGMGCGCEVKLHGVRSIVARRRGRQKQNTFDAVRNANRPKALDPALWRRFGLQVAIDLPGDDERFAILSRYLDPWQLPEADMDMLCALTDGASPALLRGVAEGIKRTLVLGPRMKWRTDEPVAVLTRIVAGLRPPPEIDPPPLWTGRDVMTKGLAGMSWPPVRKGA